ncbi:MAG TPA: hypothetical protein VFQ53_39345 [Kofleriaceae bacterium]|nr:hypothetical protein [Kofleriaceae bacterium]
MTDDRESALRAAIERASPVELAQACHALRIGFRQVLGVPVPDDATARAHLTEVALDRLRACLPGLSDDACAQVVPIIEDRALPIDVTDYRARLAARRDQARAGALASAWASEPRNEELEDTLAADLSRAESYSVLADWLQQHGHPRGELIALHLQAERDPRVLDDADAHLERHRDALLGPLANHYLVHDGSGRLAFTWQRGFITEAIVSHDDAAHPDLDVTLSDLLALVLGHPSARYLRKLTIGLAAYPWEPLDESIRTLATHAPRHLVELVIGDDRARPCDISACVIGDLAPLWAALPGLRSLHVRGAGFELGTIEHAAIEQAVFSTGGLSASAARAIATARWPRLDRLDVWYGHPMYGAEASIEDVEALLARDDLPELVHLGIVDTAFSDAVGDRLARSPLASQVRELDLSLGTMTAAGADALAAAASNLRRVRVLDVSQNYLDGAAIEALRRAFPQVIADDQRELDDGNARYPAVGE